MLREGQDAYVLALGPTLEYALAATRDLPNVGVVNARFVKPLDEALLLELAASADALVTVEDHALAGGLGSAVAEMLLDHGASVKLKRLGIPDQAVPHGDPKAQHEVLGFGPKGIRRALNELGVIPRARVLEATD